ncbi:MAG TPA: HAD family hydrolase [Candidatus Deferrimicrobium sp.]|nr:HAD family hydrolase [Candidatus Deferrimicrobium sp.]
MDEIKAIILDFDGNLYNNVVAMKAATEDALKKYEVSYDSDKALAETTRLIEKIKTSALSKIILNAWELLADVEYLEGRKFLEKAEIVFYAYTLYKDYVKESTLFSGVPELLKDAKKRYKIAIVTSGSRVDTIEVLKQFDIFQYFDEIISADDVENTKPHPEGLLKILQKFQILPNEAVYAGDLVLDIKAGQNAGIPTIAVSTGLVPRSDLEAEKPTKIIRHITELTKILPGLTPIAIDIEADFTKEIKERREPKPASEEPKISFTDKLKSITIDDLKDLLKHPLEFIRDKLNEYMKELSAGEVKEALTVFEGVEEDLLRVLGLISIHALNERLGNVLMKMFQTEYGAYLGYLNYEFMVETIKTVFPDAFFDEIRDILVIVTHDLLPENVYTRLAAMKSYDFMGYILDGAKLAMRDLGMQTFELREFIGDKFSDDEMGVIEFVWELVKTIFSVTINIMAIPMKITLQQSKPMVKEAIQVTLESFSRILETVDTNILTKTEKFGKLGEFLQKLVPKTKGPDENSGNQD